MSILPIVSHDFKQVNRGHFMIMIGPLGSDKTMLAKRLPTILI